MSNLFKSTRECVSMTNMKIILCISIQTIKVKLWCIGTCFPPKLRLRLFRLKLISGNQFPENHAFGCAVKFGQTENVFLTEKSAKND